MSAFASSLKIAKFSAFDSHDEAPSLVVAEEQLCQVMGLGKRPRAHANDGFVAPRGFANTCRWRARARGGRETPRGMVVGPAFGFSSSAIRVCPDEFAMCYIWLYIVVQCWKISPEFRLEWTPPPPQNT